jgi:hypothetical protein
MYSFLVLGLIPGTNVQISFQIWLVMLACSPLAILAFALRHRLRRAAELGSLSLRQPLYASQLHQQVQ